MRSISHREYKVERKGKEKAHSKGTQNEAVTVERVGGGTNPGGAQIQQGEKEERKPNSKQRLHDQE